MSEEVGSNKIDAVLDNHQDYVNQLVPNEFEKPVIVRKGGLSKCEVNIVYN